MDVLNVFATYGFDVADNSGLELQWDLSTNTWYNGATALLSGYPGPANSGPGGIAAWKWNGNMVKTRILPSVQSSLSVGMNWGEFVALGSGTLPTWNQFLQFAAPGQVVLAVEAQLDGTLIVLQGGTGATGSGAQLGRTGVIFSPGSWLAGYLELTAIGLGTTSTTWALYLNDALLLSGTANTLSLGMPDRVNVCNQGVGGAGFNGVAFDNVYIGDTRLGPARVTTLLPISDAAGVWGAVPGPTRFSAVDDRFGDPSGYPDGDSSYISPTTGSQLFTVGATDGTPSPCYGRVLGVMVNVCLSGSGSVDVIVVQQSTPTTVGTITATGGYHTRQVFVPLSLVSGTFWNDAEINGTFWGLGNASGVRVTQMFLEKVVSLRNVPYSCGGGSYSF